MLSRFPAFVPFCAPTFAARIPEIVLCALHGIAFAVRYRLRDFGRVCVFVLVYPVPALLPVVRGLSSDTFPDCILISLVVSFHCYDNTHAVGRYTLHGLPLALRLCVP